MVSMPISQKKKNGTYERAPTDGSAWLAKGGGYCDQRVLRGGSWSLAPENLRSASRYRSYPTYRYNTL